MLRVQQMDETQSLTLEARLDSKFDGASKLLFRTRGGRTLETVILRIRSGRTTLCVSSQVGCAARCGFCATGQMNGVVNLTTADILDQVVLANQLLEREERSIRNVVFMGMGEPFHNEDAVNGAVEALVDARRFGLAPRHVLVSTVGVPDAMRRFARRWPRVGMALSLHAARQDVREGFIPLARRHPLDELRAAMADAIEIQERPLMVEIVLLDGVNDADADLDSLIAFLDGFPVHVNLIPYNAVPGLDFSASPEVVRTRFAEALRGAGYTVTIRRSLGADIAAACGQLARQG